MATKHDFLQGIRNLATMALKGERLRSRLTIRFSMRSLSERVPCWHHLLQGDQSLRHADHPANSQCQTNLVFVGQQSRRQGLCYRDFLYQIEWRTRWIRDLCLVLSVALALALALALPPCPR